MMKRHHDDDIDNIPHVQTKDPLLYTKNHSKKLPSIESLTNQEIYDILLDVGCSPGPVVASTRQLYETRLKAALDPSSPLYHDTTSRLRRIPSTRRPLIRKELAVLETPSVVYRNNDNYTPTTVKYDTNRIEDMGLLNSDELEKELETRNDEREDMLLRIKSLTDKHHSVKEALKREESIKRHQLLIMKKTHETQLEIKNSLIRNLEDIIDEQAARMFNLEGQLAGIRSLSPPSSKPFAGVTRLVNQIEDLTIRTVELTEQMKTGEHCQETLNDEICTLNSKLKLVENQALDEQTSCKTDNEKQIQKLEEENKRLVKKNNALIIDLKKAKAEVEKRESNIESMRYDNKEIQDAMQAKISNLELLNNTLQNEIGRLKDEITLLSSNSKNITQVKEELNKDLQNEAEQLKVDNSKLQSAVAILQKAVNDRNSDVIRYKSHVSELQEELTSAQSQLNAQSNATDDKVKRLETNLARFRRESECVKQRQCDTVISLDCMKESLKVLRQEQQDLLREASIIPAEITKEMVQCKQQVMKYSSMCVQELIERYKKEMALRKKYHNQLVELKGNIRVYCRVRPLLNDETGDGSCVEFDQQDDASVSVLTATGRKQKFTVDRCFQPTTTQEMVFSEIRPLVTSSIDGYNVCIFAFGQTGSGKTYTMEGTESDPGINQRALNALFEETNARSDDWQYSIQVSMLEIYNEQIRDLLSTEQHADTKLEVKLNSDGQWHVPGIRTSTVSNIDQVNQVFALGHNSRVTASTNMNEHSSRSHALLCVQVHGFNPSTKVKSIGKLNLVDLAGSERVSKSAASGERLKEAQFINKSLSSLFDVIAALRNKQNHVPFRNSKLTHLLQDSLSGDSKTLMVVQVSPAVPSSSETVCSMNFAQRVKCVELGAASAKLLHVNGNSPICDSSSEDGNYASPTPTTFTRTPSRNYKSKTGSQRRPL